MRALLPIDDPQDPRIADYANVRDRDLARAAEGEGVFVAEGEVVVRLLAERGRYRVRSMLLEARRVEPLRDVIAALPDDVPVYVVSQDVIDRVVGFHIHRGILAVGERGGASSPEALLREDGLVVGICGVTNHDNVGSIFRSAAAFGVRSVLLDGQTCDPLYRKAIRVSVGAALVVPFARVPSAEAMCEVLEGAGYEVLSLSPRADTALDALGPTKRRALLLGAEGPGLAPAILARTRAVRIPMAPGLDSLNVSVACGIALYEVARRS